jgi:hypothetical protein
MSPPPSSRPPFIRLNGTRRPPATPIADGLTGVSVPSIHAPALLPGIGVLVYRPSLTFGVACARQRCGDIVQPLDRLKYALDCAVRAKIRGKRFVAEFRRAGSIACILKAPSNRLLRQRFGARFQFGDESCQGFDIRARRFKRKIFLIFFVARLELREESPRALFDAFGSFGDVRCCGGA